jgi:hypothetical protein
MAATKTNAKAVAELLNRGVEVVEVRGHLAQRLESGDKLRVKFGVDPTGADLHQGHAVVLYKLRQWQDLGHHVILLIGDFTATIGDPSGRNDARPMLTPQQIEANWASYAEQAGKILDMSKVEIRRNHEWYGQWSLAQLLETRRSEEDRNVVHVCRGPQACRAHASAVHSGDGAEDESSARRSVRRRHASKVLRLHEGVASMEWHEWLEEDV